MTGMNAELCPAYCGKGGSSLPQGSSGVGVVGQECSPQRSQSFCVALGHLVQSILK